MAIFNKVTILSLALLLSLCANVGLVSFMMGRGAAQSAAEPTDSGSPRAAAAAGAILADVARELPAEQRRAIRQVVQERRPATREAVLALQDQRRDVAEMLKEDKLDTAAITAALVELRARTTKAQEIGHRFLMELLPHLPAPQRRELIERQRNLVR